MARLIVVVFFFRGKRARESNDVSVLSRRDQHVTITLVIYLACLISALFTKNFGFVMAIREQSEFQVSRTSVLGSFTWPCTVRSCWHW
jgi:hypothetical protein